MSISEYGRVGKRQARKALENAGNQIRSKRKDYCASTVFERWRWRESNPRPTNSTSGIYVCSQRFNVGITATTDALRDSHRINLRHSLSVSGMQHPDYLAPHPVPSG